MFKRNAWVVGHKNPDTDSICAAIAYANLKNVLAMQEGDTKQSKKDLSFGVLGIVSRKN